MNVFVKNTTKCKLNDNALYLKGLRRNYAMLVYLLFFFILREKKIKSKIMEENKKSKFVFL